MLLLLIERVVSQHLLEPARAAVRARDLQRTNAAANRLKRRSC